MDFFSRCRTTEEAKSVFRMLSKHFHPDRGGDANLMVELQKQYNGWNPSNFNWQSQFPDNRGFSTQTENLLKNMETNIKILENAVITKERDIQLLRLELENFHEMSFIQKILWLFLGDIYSKS